MLEVDDRDIARRCGTATEAGRHSYNQARVVLLKEKKAALAASLFDPDGEPTLAMTEADIEMLLAS